MSKVIVQVKLNLNKMLTIWIRALNMITTTSMCAIVLRIAVARDALRNRKLLIDCSWNWKGSKPKMLFFEDKQQREGMLWISFWKLMQRSGHIQVCATKKLSITWSSMLLRNLERCITRPVQKRLFQPRFAEISRYHQKRQGHRGNCQWKKN